MINYKSSLENSFQEILYLVGNRINKGSGWIVESIESHTLTFQFTDHYQEVLM